MIKPSKKQCQAEILQGSFMTFGPRKHIRCVNKPVCIATENKVPKNMRVKGSMSLCENCKKILIQKMGRKYATITSIT